MNGSVVGNDQQRISQEGDTVTFHIKISMSSHVIIKTHVGTVN